MICLVGEVLFGGDRERDFDPLESEGILGRFASGDSDRDRDRSSGRERFSALPFSTFCVLSVEGLSGDAERASASFFSEGEGDRCFFGDGGD